MTLLSLFVIIFLLILLLLLLLLLILLLLLVLYPHTSLQLTQPLLPTYSILILHLYHQLIFFLIILFLPQLLTYQRTYLTRHCLQWHILHLHTHPQFPVMSWTVYMSDIRHVAFESLTAYITVKYLCHFLLLICVNLTNILINVQPLLSSYQHTLMPSCINHCIILNLILWLLSSRLNHLLKTILLSSKTIHLCSQTMNYFLLLVKRHLFFLLNF